VNAQPGWLPSPEMLRKYSYLTCTFVILTKLATALRWRTGRSRQPVGRRVLTRPRALVNGSLKNSREAFDRKRLVTEFGGVNRMRRRGATFVPLLRQGVSDAAPLGLRQLHRQ
jgi:hypothetical protein